MRPLRAFAGAWCWACGGALALLLARCDAHMVIGADFADGSDQPGTDDGGGDAGFAPLSVPWSTGFENGFSDWTTPAGQGFCYFMGGATFAIVSAPAPVHTGAHAASFTVNSANINSAARCYRQGILPQAAYYGAWYYVPAPAQNMLNWNLLHFRGGPNFTNTHGLWDVSLLNEPDGALDPAIYDHLRTRVVEAGPPAIPIGQWFHLEVFFRRSDAGTGEFTLYRDEQMVMTAVAQIAGVATDDSFVGSWHVGNLANALNPPVSTVYVDDVSISLDGP